MIDPRVANRHRRMIVVSTVGAMALAVLGILHLSAREGRRDSHSAGPSLTDGAPATSDKQCVHIAKRRRVGSPRGQTSGSPLAEATSFLDDGVLHGAFEVSLGPSEPYDNENPPRYRVRRKFLESYRDFVEKARLTEEQECQMRQALADAGVALLTAQGERVADDVEIYLAQLKQTEKALQQQMKRTYDVLLTPSQIELLNGSAEYRILRIPHGLGSRPFVSERRDPMD